MPKKPFRDLFGQVGQQKPYIKPIDRPRIHYIITKDNLTIDFSKVKSKKITLTRKNAIALSNWIMAAFRDEDEKDDY